MPSSFLIYQKKTMPSCQLTRATRGACHTPKKISSQAVTQKCAASDLTKGLGCVPEPEEPFCQHPSRQQPKPETSPPPDRAGAPTCRGFGVHRRNPAAKNNEALSGVRSASATRICPSKRDVCARRNLAREQQKNGHCPSQAKGTQAICL